MVSDEPTIPAPLDIDVPPPALDAPEVAPVAAEAAPVDEAKQALEEAGLKVGNVTTEVVAR